MNCPPTKRLRGLDQDVATVVAFDDPFGDDEDFTQADLDEIDVIASQAFTSTAASGFGSKSETSGSAWSVKQNKPACKANQSRENTFGFGSNNNRGNARIPSRDPLGNRQHQFGSDKGDSYSSLEAQHAALKRKLKEVEDEILLKSGEIQVLRDSLKTAQQEKDTQRQNQILLETQRQREQSDREKELNKKVQSLQSELQFKEAEINEMKTKLHSTDRNKVASPLPRNSPKVLSNLIHLHHGSSSSSSSSSSPIANGFITKGMFGAHIPSKTTPVKTKRDGGDRGSSSRRPGEGQEVSRPDPFLSVRLAHLQHRGGVLLGLLLQQPLSPSSLGLSHLLSMSLTDIHMTAGGLSAGSVSGGEGGVPRAALSPDQSLAITGLNMLSQSRPETAAHSRSKCSCPGAVLLLPLLDLHLSRLCQALDSLRSTTTSGSNSPAATSLTAGPAAPTDGLGRLEETGFSLEDIGLASLRLLYLMVSHSDEVVEAVLTKESQNRVSEKKELSAACLGLCSQNSLLQSVLRLCEAGLGSCTGIPHKEKIGLNAMKTLCVLIERTPHTHAERLQCVLQALCVCLSADNTFETVSVCVSVLLSMSDHQTLVQQLCLQHDPCVFMKLFQFIRTRTDQATHTDWIQLDLQVVRLLSRLMTCGVESWTSSQHSACQCYTELVQTVVIVFHRQWLDLRGSQELMDSSGLGPPLHQSPSHSLHGTATSLLRECLLLLHWLLLHHSSFSESCRPLLHMYDQVIPAVRDTLRKIPQLSESEEVALEEICRSDGDDIDDMDTETLS